MNREELITESGKPVIIECGVSEDIINTGKPLTLEEINSKLDDITLLMLQQGGIIA